MSKTTTQETVADAIEENQTETVQIDPAIRALAEQQASDENESTVSFVESTVKTYLADTLRGQEPWIETSGVTDRQLTIDADPALEQLIAATATVNGEEDADSFVVKTLCEAIGLDVDERELPIGGLEEMNELVVATTENEACPHETRDEVVQAALERRLL
ncbi:hypothetical protein [Natronoglomus mannanivorans]|uniref:Uncharacterized protein n=1 Tax=Natronoglomus mannanivorans TaxID=2979990 RepID=A0AAP2Z3V2_9EURY|nr:hypothetical protein [Halobacteria archaeon AArc-xg1-1]